MRVGHFFTHCLCFCVCYILGLSGRKERLAELITRIVSLIDAGHQTKEISELTGKSGCSIRRWLTCYKEGGGIQVPIQKARSGRPRKVNRADMNILLSGIWRRTLA